MDLMGLYEVAHEAGVTPQAVSNWIVRKTDFPAPVATLASGPIWAGEPIRAWLKQEGKSSVHNRKEHHVMEFAKGKEYTHAQLVATLGGDTVSYLPTAGGIVVGGRFRHDEMNPEAPYKIIVGDLPRVKAKATTLAAQAEPIPVFLKEGVNRWRFHGLMKCEGFAVDASTLAHTPGVKQRSERVAGVLTLRDVFSNA